ncbi:LysR family transcriptional regulator [Pseudomonas sp. ABFPK]|uniref:LysR family transcriptional regulator n=1 Tax=Pseudomonas sp. ABFPK TaxID=1636605 RepID=UPI0009EDB28E
MAKQIEPDLTLTTLPSLRAIRAFVAAAKYQSFTRAAESLGVSQAAISRQIKELETNLNTDLFTRAGRSVALTSAGKLFFQTAEQSLCSISQATEKIRSIQKLRRPLSPATPQT